MPAEAKLSVPGLDLASATNSCTVVAGKSGGAMDERHRGELADAHKFAHLERQVLVHHGRDGVAVRGDEQRVAVGRGLRDRRRPGEPRAIVDDHLLVPGLAQFLGDGAREPVRYAAGAQVHDDADGLVGIIRVLRRAPPHNDSDRRAPSNPRTRIMMSSGYSAGRKASGDCAARHRAASAYLPCGGPAPTRAPSSMRCPQWRRVDRSATMRPTKPGRG